MSWHHQGYGLLVRESVHEQPPELTAKEEPRARGVYACLRPSCIACVCAPVVVIACMAGGISLGSRGTKRGESHALAPSAVVASVLLEETACGPAEPGVDYVTTRSYRIPDVPSSDACCAKCQAVPECMAWTWVSESGLIAGSPTECYLKGGKWKFVTNKVPKGGGPIPVKLMSGNMTSRQPPKDDTLSTLAFNFAVVKATNQGTPSSGAPAWHLAAPGQTCDAACDGAGMTCDAAASHSRNGDVDSDGAMREVVQHLGKECTDFDHSWGSASDVPLFRKDGRCIVSEIGRKQSTFDCKFTSPHSGAQRLCMCTPGRSAGSSCPHAGSELPEVPDPPDNGGLTSDVTVLSFNLYWWSLFDRGRMSEFHWFKETPGNGAIDIIRQYARYYDFLAFQECIDVGWILAKAGMAPEYEALQGPEEVCLAYRRENWEAIAQGWQYVSDDLQQEFWRRRGTQWVQLKHRASSRRVLFMNHHGPLPVGSGGTCGGEGTAHNLLKLAADKADGGAVILGDFNAGSDSVTLEQLRSRLTSVTTGNAFGGVDNILTSLGPDMIKSGTQLGDGGSDHAAIVATLRV